MRESIVCIGRTGSKPYRFSETGVCISSYEELCYYLRGHMLCYLYTLPEEELLTYLRDELGLYKLYHQLIKFTDPVRDQMKYFSTLFREGNYFSEEEIHQILDEYRYLKNLPYALQCKMTGDMYLQAGRAAMAIYYYKEALKGEALTAAETGAVYHNRGIARARLFRIREAEKDFVHAYRYSGEEESLFYYYCLIALTENLEKAEKEGKTTVRLHTGDPCIYGAIREQMDILDEKGIAYDSCPGVSSFCGAASALNLEYTLPEISQSVIITRMEGRTPVPSKESIQSFAAHQASMVIFLSTGMLEELSRRLIEGGYREDTPAAIVYKATWPDEKKFICTVGTLAKTAADNNITKTALMIIGDAVNAADYDRSKLYDPSFTTEFRKATK